MKIVVQIAIVHVIIQFLIIEEELVFVDVNLKRKIEMEKSEQEIIEEIVSSHVVLTRSDGSAIWARKLCISVANEALQKGKELGAEKAYTCSCEFGCNPCHALCNKCAVFGQAQKASKIAELEKENRELKEQNSKLADELEGLKIITTPENRPEGIVRHNEKLIKIIKRLRGEKE